MGHFAGKLFKEDQQESLTKTCGVSVLFIAVAGAMQGMLKVENGMLTAGRSMLVVLCLLTGTLFGEIIEKVGPLVARVPVSLRTRFAAGSVLPSIPCQRPS